MTNKYFVFIQHNQLYLRNSLQEQQTFKMPQKTNGHGAANGFNGNGNSYDMEDGQTFLFTSESVGEGHPGKCRAHKNSLICLYV